MLNDLPQPMIHTLWIIGIAILKAIWSFDMVLCVLVLFAIERVYHEKAINTAHRRLKKLTRSDPPYSDKTLGRIRALNNRVTRHKQAIWRNRHFS